MPHPFRLGAARGRIIQRLPPCPDLRRGGELDCQRWALYLRRLAQAIQLGRDDREIILARPRDRFGEVGGGEQTVQAADHRPHRLALRRIRIRPGVGREGRGLLRPPAEEIFRAGDHEEEVGIVGCGVGQDGALPGVDEIVGGNGITVGPLRFGAEMEPPGQAVIGEGRQGRGRGGKNREIVVVPAHQALVEGMRETQILQVAHPLRIEREDLILIDEDQIRLRRRVIQPDDHGEDDHNQRERRKQLHHRSV